MTQGRMHAIISLCSHDIPCSLSNRMNEDSARSSDMVIVCLNLEQINMLLICMISQ
jgi:hypothetical protein